MKYPITQDSRYDFIGQRYGQDCYPNLHKYPATMLPQLGIEVLKELKITQGSMLDPYCGSGSSFAAGLAVGIKCFRGYDLNPLAVLITKARFTQLPLAALATTASRLKETVIKTLCTDQGDLFCTQNSRPPTFALAAVRVEKFNNFDYWFGDTTARALQYIKNQIAEVVHPGIRRFLLIPLSLTLRDCSYVRNNEFKLYRIKPEAMGTFSPDVSATFLHYLEQCLQTYQTYYHPHLNNLALSVRNQALKGEKAAYDVVLTSPPYGDSRTTVAYGQFSLFTNAWLLGQSEARSVDKQLMGGVACRSSRFEHSTIGQALEWVQRKNPKRADEVTSFYLDLQASMIRVAKAIQPAGWAIYVVGNRSVKGCTLPTDQFVAECFEAEGFRHQATYQRIISNKRMPARNSPTNQPGQLANTISHEYVVVCQKAAA